MELRSANTRDAADLLQIYEQYIHSAVTFECKLPSCSEFAERIASISTLYPYLVAVENHCIIGYAYAHRFQSREAYQWSAELSIYLDTASVGRGRGSILYSKLIRLLARQGVRTVYGCVALPNPASERLHVKLGFHSVGVFHNAGFKNNQWHSIAWFEKNIAAYDDMPQPLIPFPYLNCAVENDCAK